MEHLIMDIIVIQKSLPDDVLPRIYNCGAKPRETLLKLWAAKAIQRWWRNMDHYEYYDHLWIRKEEPTKGEIVWSLLHDYTDNEMIVYPEFAIQKVYNLHNKIIQEPIDTKRSTIRRWLWDNFTEEELRNIGL